MRKILTALFLLSFAPQFEACVSANSDLNQCWFFTYEAKSREPKKSNLTAASFLCLRKDSTYTRDFGVFDFGKWSYDRHELILESKNGQSARMNILRLQGHEMVADLEGQTLNFDGQPLLPGIAEDGPFDLRHNLWRIPATQRESDSAIRQRLINHCQYWEAYFSWALKSGQQTIDVRSTPTPIKIFGNGFGLKKVEDQPSRWKAYFYDEDDCAKAFDILKNSFEKNEIGWAHTDNKYKMFLGAFQQLEETIKRN